MNSEVQLTLEEAVAEVNGILTGLELSYDPALDRFRAITRALNRALRANALEAEWSFYSSHLDIPVVAGQSDYLITPDSSRRPRIINDDAVRIVDANHNVVLWAYFLPRDALHKYRYQPGWFCSVTRDVLSFSKPLNESMTGMIVQVPVMREPTMFRLPEIGVSEVPEETLDQLIDFHYPDIITARAAFYYAQTDPIMQPRTQTLEDLYKGLMYQAIERDDRNTETPFQNEFLLPVQNGIYPEMAARPYPLSDRRL